MIRAIALYFLASAAMIAALGVGLGLVFTAPAERHALLVSAIVALVVQLMAFALVRALRGSRQVIVAYGIGAAARLVTLVFYALVVVRSVGLPPTAALISMAVFLFLTTILEPVMLSL